MNRTAARLILTLGLAAVVCGTVGCTTTNWPYGMSRGRHNYPSTPTAPKTVKLVDTVTDQDLLIIDVPVGKTLVMDLGHNKRWVATQSGSTPADRVKWSIVDTGTRGTYGWQDHMKLTGNPVAIKVELRDPEPAGGAGVAQTGPKPAADEPAVPIQRGPATTPDEQPKSETQPEPPDEQADGPASSTMGASDSPSQEIEQPSKSTSQPNADETKPESAAEAEDEPASTGEDLEDALE